MNILLYCIYIFNDATCWPWVATCKAWERDLGGWTFSEPKTEVVRDLGCYTLDFTELYGQLKRSEPINRSVISRASIYIIVPTVSFKVANKCSTLFFKNAPWKLWLRFNRVEKKHDEYPEFDTKLHLTLRHQSWSLENEEYYFITISLKSTLTRSGSTC